MTKNNDEQFKKGLAALKKVGLKGDERVALFNNLLRYAEKHPVQEAAPFYLAFWRTLRGRVLALIK